MANVSTPGTIYERLSPDWRMIQALTGGTRAMREAGKIYLPQNPHEDDADYSDRLNQATLAPFFNKTLSNLNGRIFARPVTLQDDVPQCVRDWCENIDRQGNAVSIFWAKAARKAIAKGSVGVLSDYPHVEGAATLADEREFGARPYLTLYPAESVIGVRFGEAGKLMEARLMETVSEPGGEFDEIEIRQVRRLLRAENQTKYEIWREKIDGSGWDIFNEGFMTIDEIPLVMVYLNPRDADYDSPPPLLDLAYLCVKHWQMQSAQDNVAEVARFPMLAAAGWHEDDPEMSIGPRLMLATSDPNGKYYYVEHSGAAIAAGRAEMERLEDQIAMEGIRPLSRQRGANVTATEVSSEDQSARSEVQVWSEKIKDGIEKSLSLMAKWAGLGDDAGGSVTLTGDFDFVGIDASALAALQQMRVSGDISRQTLWEELKRRGILSDDFDPDEEDVRLAEEGPDLSLNSGDMAREMPAGRETEEGEDDAGTPRL